MPEPNTTNDVYEGGIRTHNSKARVRIENERFLDRLNAGEQGAWSGFLGVKIQVDDICESNEPVSVGFKDARESHLQVFEQITKRCVDIGLTFADPDAPIEAGSPEIWSESKSPSFCRRRRRLRAGHWREQMDTQHGTQDQMNGFQFHFAS